MGVLFTLCYWPFTVPSLFNFILCSAVRLWLFAFVPVVILLWVWLQSSVGFPVPTWLTVKFRCDNELLSLDSAFHKQSRSSSWQPFAMIPFSSSIIFTFGFVVYPDPILLDAIVQCLWSVSYPRRFWSFWLINDLTYWLVVAYGALLLVVAS